MPTFGKRSLDNLAGVHPDLRRVCDLAIQHIDFTVICGYRGKSDQEAAFAAGNTKVHYPNSAHNQTGSKGEPRACAVDVIPYPFKGWNDPGSSKELKAISTVMFDAAKSLGIELRWGGDFNRDGDKTTNDSWDKPHFELHPWREYAKR